MLLAKGANPNIRDDSGRSPLEWTSQQFYSPRSGSTTPAPGITFSRDFAVPNVPMLPPGAFRSDQSQKSLLGQMLKEHGALEVLPDMDRIQYSRKGKFDGRLAFQKSTNDWNRFTLLELLGVAYDFLDSSPQGADRSLGQRANMGPRELAFPDFSRIQIRRPSGDPIRWVVKTVDVETMLKSGNCAEDVQLLWGDIVEIPEADHLLNEGWQGLPLETLNALNKCWTRRVEVIVKGQRNALTLAADFKPTASPYEPGVRTEARLWIKPALRESKLLLASSDLSRIKVTRKDPATGYPRTYILDCSDEKPAPDFWLLDGDVIEVPERPQ